MLVIRLFRVGKKNQPSFKIVVTQKTRPPRAGVFVEEVGFYNPVTKEKVLKAERIKYWLQKGVKPSDTVHNLLVKDKIIEGKKRPVKIRAKTKEEAEKKAEEASTPKPEEPKPEEGHKEEEPATPVAPETQS
jgi:small subunit ribosomal protein S16